jgi:Fe2+ transport system protein FeoA
MMMHAQAGDVLEPLFHALEEQRCVASHEELHADLSNPESRRAVSSLNAKFSVVDRLCAFLGLRAAGTRAEPAAAGECRAARPLHTEPFTMRIIDLPGGTSASIAFIDSKSAARIQRLAAFGIVPGSEVRVIARRPSCVLACGASSIALDEEIAREIYVRVGDDRRRR